MARTAGSNGEKTMQALREQATLLIARHGFEAVTMRQLGDAVGVGAPALYRYFPTKQDLLATLIGEHMADLADGWARAVSGLTTPDARLDAFVAHHIAFHVERRLSTQIANLELRSLDPANLTAAMKARNDYERQLRLILRDGVEAGLFDIDDLALAAMAIIQMITGVIVWFRPGERLTVEDVTAQYQTMVRRLVGASAGQREA